MAETLVILKTAKKGPYRNSLEKYYVYKNSQFGMPITNTYSDMINQIFKILYKYKVPNTPLTDFPLTSTSPYTEPLSPLMTHQHKEPLP
jgi:hypothetical protein